MAACEGGDIPGGTNDKPKGKICSKEKLAKSENGSVSGSM